MYLPGEIEKPKPKKKIETKPDKGITMIAFLSTFSFGAMAASVFLLKIDRSHSIPAIVAVAILIYVYQRELKK